MLFPLFKSKPKQNTFAQQKQRVENEFSVNIATEFTFKNKIHKGWINVLNPFRGSLIMGTLGSGKSVLIVHEYIRQQIEKGYTMCIYDFKSPNLSRLAYHHYLKNSRGYQKMHGRLPSFHNINFTALRSSSRCNPLSGELLIIPADAYVAAETILCNLNKTWIQKQGDFFVESPIRFLACCIWYMKRYNDRMVKEFLSTLPKVEREKPGVTDHINYCTFPHIIEFATQPYELISPLLIADADLEDFDGEYRQLVDENSEAENQKQDLFKGIQAQLSALATPALYWIMMGTNALVDINNPDAPKILCLGNTPEHMLRYSAPLALIAAMLVKRINRPGQVKCSLIFDELPTVYVPYLDNLLATGRSNKIAPCLVIHDYQQLVNSYGQKNAKVLTTCVGTVFSGQVLGETADLFSARLNKEPIITAQTLMRLPAGHFIGEIASCLDNPVPERVFYAQLGAGQQPSTALENMPELPHQPTFVGVSDEQMETILLQNVDRIKNEIKQVLEQVV